MRCNNIYFIIVILCGTIIFGCKDSKPFLVLELAKLDSKYKIDTVEAYPKRGIYLLSLRQYYTFGRFSLSLAIVKRTEKSNTIVYRLPSFNDKEERISWRNISFVKPTHGQLNWGWFTVENGSLNSKLPGMSKILDSLQGHSPHDAFVNENNGYIYIRYNSGRIEEFNYGQFVVGKSYEYDRLEYKLYQLDGHTLRIKSDNPDDLFKQKAGTYFIPPPGYGLIERYDKMKLFDMVDSASTLALLPSSLYMPALSPDR